MSDIVQWIAKYWIQVVFGIITAWLTASYKKLANKIKQNKLQEQAERDALLAILDDSMGKIYAQCKERGYATKEQFRRYVRLYTAYHDGLHGNGAVSIQYQKFKKLDLREE